MKGCADSLCPHGPVLPAQWLYQLRRLRWHFLLAILLRNRAHRTSFSELWVSFSLANFCEGLAGQGLLSKERLALHRPQTVLCAGLLLRATRLRSHGFVPTAPTRKWMSVFARLCRGRGTSTPSSL